jgi:hypothetical protein
MIDFLKENISSIFSYALPIISALLGAGFSFKLKQSSNLNDGNSVGNIKNTNITGDNNVVSTTNKIDQSIRNINISHKTTSSGNEIGAFIVFVIFVFFIIYLYISYVDIIFRLINTMIISCSVFTISFNIIFLFRKIKSTLNSLIYCVCSNAILGLMYLYSVPLLMTSYNLEVKTHVSSKNFIFFLKTIKSQEIILLSSHIFSILFMIMYMIHLIQTFTLSRVNLVRYFLSLIIFLASVILGSKEFFGWIMTLT